MAALPIIARALAKKAVTRKRKPGDDAWNARRRFARSAERYLEKAEKSQGALAGRYRELARGELKRALDTYEKEPTSKMIRGLMDKLGVSKSDKKPSPQRRAEVISKSRESLESSRGNIDARREREARAIMNSKVGKRIYAGLVGVWRGSDDIDQAIMDYFGTDNMADVLEALESEINIYDDPESIEKYDDVRLIIEQFAARRTA